MLLLLLYASLLREISLGWPRSISCLAGSVCPRLLPSNCWPVGYIARLHCLTFDPHKYSPPLTIWCKPQPQSKCFALLHQVWLPMHLFQFFCLDWQFSPPIFCGVMCWHVNDINSVGFVLECNWDPYVRFCLYGPFGGPPFPCEPLQMYFFLCLPKLKFEPLCIVCGMPVSKFWKCRNSSWHYMIKEYVPRSVALLASSYSNLSYPCTKSYVPYMSFIKCCCLLTYNVLEMAMRLLKEK